IHSPLTGLPTIFPQPSCPYRSSNLQSMSAGIVLRVPPYDHLWLPLTKNDSRRPGSEMMVQIVQSNNEPPAASGPTVSTHWDLPWLASYAPGIPFSISYPDAPVFTLLEEAARRWGNRTAVICFESRITFSELLTKSYQFAHALKQLGVKRGHRVGILLPNVPEYVIAINGLWMVG